MADLLPDIMGRIARLPLKPSEGAALLPLHEAISNSLHSIRDRFGDDAPERGRVDIEVLRAENDESVLGFTVEDNGIGFNDDNYKSFLTPDSRYKAGRGGKGVGRLAWLKVFGDVHVDSVYAFEGGTRRRQFDFILSESNQVRLAPGDGTADASVRTKVRLRSFKDAFGVHCPVKTDTIVERIIAHFLPIFAAQSGPVMVLHDVGGEIDLRAYFLDRIDDQAEEDIEIGVGADRIQLRIRHIKCDKSIRPRGNRYNWLCLCAHERDVKDFCIDEQIGLRSLGDALIYIGCVSGQYLDENVNPQRDNFIFDVEQETGLRRALAEHVRIYLEDYLREVLLQKTAATQALISENPQYLYLNGELEEFVRGLAPNSTTKEQIYVDMARHRFRRQRDFRRVGADISNSQQYNEAVKEKVEEYKRYIQDEQRGALAEYVTKRKAVLDLLEKLRGFANPEEQRHHLEEAVHKLICPMRIDSSRLEIEDHNLWILDDRLAFFNFFASDKRVNQYTDGSSEERPDLAFFYDSCVAWREGDRMSDKVVLVEFKRPGRENYSNEDPYRQVLGYVSLFKSSGSVRDINGNVITGVTQNTAFDCYIVADLTDGLRRCLLGFGEPTPDGMGMFGYTNNPRAYLEIIPYQKLLQDAKARNAIFFQKLGLNG